MADAAEADATTPLLPPPHQQSMDDILLILATNFLLYAALVLISYLVVKLYIESTPENPLFDEDTTYHRVPSTHSGEFLRAVSY
jgi:hypothetical protein